MPHAQVSDRLSPLDALFLYIEKKEMPLHIGSVFVFDGPIAVGDLKALVESKLPLIGRYRQRVVFPPLNAGYPTWEDDPDFDIDRHLRGVRLATGSLEELQDLAGKCFSQIMDRDRPLWDLTLVDGYQGERSALIARVHHCLVDGVAGVRLMNLILAGNPDAPFPVKTEKHPFHPRPLPTPERSFTDAVISSYSHTLDRLFSLQSAALAVAAATFGEAIEGTLGRAVAQVPELVQPVKPFPFNQPCQGPRRVSWAEIPMSEISACREPYGVKVNDIGLMLLAAAARRYARVHHVPVKNRPLRLMVPVNLRGDDIDGSLGNRISLIPVNIPLDIADPGELLRSIHERTVGLKHAHAASVMALGGTFLTVLPVPVQATLCGLLSNNVSVLPFDMVCTNVPGPVEPLYLLGRKMLTYYPYVPIGDFMGICCAMASYNGTMYFGLTGDSALAPDLDRLRDFLHEAFTELREDALARRSGRKPASSSHAKPARRRAENRRAAGLRTKTESMGNTTPSPSDLGVPISSEV